MKTPEYIEGKQAQENFEEGMKALFRVPKEAVPAKKKPAKKRAKPRQPVSRDSGCEA